MNFGVPRTALNASGTNPQKVPNLNADLHAGLSVDLAFSGNFFHRSTEANAPNPGLSISGLGSIGLPLSERDAKAIVSQAAQAPFGKGLKTVVDTTVRDTWEIDPASISFTNPAWERFVDEVATKKVWTALGVAPYSTKPKCELYKLLLYQKGSHFLPHQDTAKANGMFATIIIVLPSAFRGGEVHVTRAGRTTVLDVSQSSNFGTSVLAWYTDVIHEVKPVTAGYRLALSYNLIHTSPNSPKPSLPSVPQGALQALSDTFKMWRDNQYKINLKLPLFVSILEHEYSQVNLNDGIEALKGKDAHLVSHIAPIAEQMGIVLCLANIERHVTGSAQDGGGCSYVYNKRRRFGYYDEYDDDEREETPEMGEVEEEEITMSNIVSITNNATEDFDWETFDLDAKALVPLNAFNRFPADESDYEGYQGNYAGSLEQWYRRSALVMFRKIDELPIIMSISGPSAVLDNLPLTNDGKPTQASREAVQTIILTLKDNSIAATIVDLAVEWEDDEIWNKAIPVVQNVDNISTSVADALEVFKIDLLKPGLAELLKRQKVLKTRLDITKALEPHFAKENQTAWIRELTADALSSYSAASTADVSTLIQLAQELEGGFATLATTVLPVTKAKTKTYDFHITFAETLNLQRNQLANLSNNVFHDLAQQCLLAAASYWAIPPTVVQNEGYLGSRLVQDVSALPQRIDTLVKLCFALKNSELCVEVLKATNGERQVEVLTAIKAHIGDTRPPWVKEAMQAVLAAYSKPIAAHTPTLAWIAQEAGAEHVQAMVVSKVPKTGSYEFLVALTKSLHERLSELCRAPDTTYESKVAFRAAIVQCLMLAAPQWEEGLATTVNQNPAYNYGYSYNRVPETVANDTKVKRIIEFVDSCFTVGDVQPCQALFNQLLRLGDTKVSDRFKEVFAPLIPQLKVALAKHSKTVTTEPFKSFLKLCIELYLGRVLSATAPAALPSFPANPVACNQFNECKLLHAFVSNSESAIQFKAVQNVRTHLERHLATENIGHILTYTTERRGTPYTLVVSKRPEMMASLKWREVHAAALAFLRSIGGTDAELKEVMQERYDDVVKALQGTKTFVMSASSKSSTAACSTAASSSAGASSSTTTAVTPSTSTGAAQVAGAKRKHRNPPTNVIDVIDLT
ncbi:hypothetical protein BJ165DRAFT_198051 [Panaeolus papilionaceus]|nr:hypothetical protein BJ165DRAFT_198051 [Panaeolus papilionaceus]